MVSPMDEQVSDSYLVSDPFFFVICGHAFSDDDDEWMQRHWYYVEIYRVIDGNDDEWIWI